jgi:hypothetical protein
LMNEINFVRGIAWHDIAKPFFLGSPKHSRTGFLLLAAAGYPEEAKAALCHVSLEDLQLNLEDYYPLHRQAPLSAILLLSNALDRLAASTYSLMENPPKNPPFEAWHNPFTRLPETPPKLDAPFQTKNRAEEIDAKLRKAMLNDAPEAWRGTLKDLLEHGGTVGRLFWPDPLGKASDEQGKPVDPIELFYKSSRAYPERTYPPVNDTILSEHTRLSAVFAWVVYRNLRSDSEGSRILDWEITLKEDGAWLPDPDGTDAVDFVSLPGENAPLSKAQELVRDHLDGYLVRVIFGGHQQLVEEAARLDDLNGAQELTRRMRDAFKYALAEQLEVGELAEFLWISESAFDLVYLLPEKAVDGEDGLGKLIQDSYAAAVEWLVDGAGSDDGRIHKSRGKPENGPFRRFLAAVRRVFERGTVKETPDYSLKKLLHDDFFEAGPLLAITGPAEMTELKEQLLTLGYNIHIERVQPPANMDGYGAFTAAYGKALLAAYKNSREGLQFPRAALDPAVSNLLKSEDQAIEDVCTICGTHAVYKPLADRLPSDEFLKKVTHTFRDEPERPCLTCVARRALAHKQVQVEALHQMLSYDAGTGEVRTQPATDPKLSVPPAMLHTSKLEDENDYRDLGAAFVRLARKLEPGRPLGIFPTVSYAADSMGNVALLTLSATDVVFDTYDYGDVRGRLEEASATEKASPVWRSFAEDFDAFCRKRVSADLLEQVQVVQPHLARVLARQARISRFFEAVASRLERAKIRALPLDRTYPTGRWMVPAMALPKALETLGESVSADLLAVPEGALDGPTRRFLALTTPPLLDGTVVVFKQKFPIYLVMAAERALRAELAAEQPVKDGAWYGMHLALADLRGTLTDRAAGKSVVTLDELPDLLALNRVVDRRTVVGRAADLGRGDSEDKWTQAVANARLFVRSGWWRLKNEERLETAQALTETEAFAPVLFLKRVARE